MEIITRQQEFSDGGELEEFSVAYTYEGSKRVLSADHKDQTL